VVIVRAREYSSRPLSLGAVDLLLVAVYCAAMIAVGVLVGRRTRGAADYFLGGRDLPAWALLLSIVATETSAVTFLSVPGLAYSGDLTFLQMPMGYVLGRLLATWLLLPHYFRGQLVTAYQVLRARFGPRVQQVGSLTFLAARTIGGGLRLFLTALVVSRLCGLSIGGAVAVITAVTLVYTFFGGMRAVVWTDVAQFGVYVAGAAAAMAIAVGRLPGGFADVLAAAGADKLRVFDLRFDLWRPYTLWSGLIGGAFLSLGSHGVDQLIVQRLLAARSQRQAAVALSLSGVVVMLQFAFFLLLGLCLFAYYRAVPPAQPFAGSDAVFADFLLTQLPTGLLGLVLGALFSAAMSSFSSSLNSSSAALVHDFVLPLTGRDPASAFALRAAKGATVLFALLEAATALLAVDDRAVIDQVLGVAALTTGVLLGLFFLGTGTRRATPAAALCGFVAGLAVDLLVYFALPAAGARPLASAWFAPLGAAVTFGVGALVATLRLSRSRPRRERLGDAH
jgi:SSS family transporter